MQERPGHGRRHHAPAAATRSSWSATQNPIEYEGTYPLPEAQLDRFLLKVILPVPAGPRSSQILQRHADGFDPHDIAAAGVRAVAGAGHVEAAAAAVRTVAVSPEVSGYVVDIARATRVSALAQPRRQPPRRHGAAAHQPGLGLAPGRDFVTPDDVKALARATLAHRLGLRPEAELEGVAVAQVLQGRGRLGARAAMSSPAASRSCCSAGVLVLLLRPAAGTAVVWVLAVLVLVAVDVAARTAPLTARADPASRRPGPAGRLVEQPRLVVANPGRATGARSAARRVAAVGGRDRRPAPLRPGRAATGRGHHAPAARRGAATGSRTG